MAMFDGKSTFSMVNSSFGDFWMFQHPNPWEHHGNTVLRSGLGSLPLTRVATPLVRNDGERGIMEVT